MMISLHGGRILGGAWPAVRPAVLAVAMLAFPGCDEALPPREPPRTVLQQSLEALRPLEVIIRDSVAQGEGGAFRARVRNIYDEVLQDSARVRLRLDILMLNEPPSVFLRKNPFQPGGVVKSRANTSIATDPHAYIEADEEYLENWRELRGGVLTLGVDTAASIRRQWSHRTDEGIPFWTLVKLYQAYTRSGEPYLLSDTIRYSVQGTVQVFKVVQPLPLPVREVRMVYKIFSTSLPLPK